VDNRLAQFAASLLPHLAAELPSPPVGRAAQQVTEDMKQETKDLQLLLACFFRMFVVGITTQKTVVLMFHFK
jgi:hypothetical protein